MRLCVVSCGIMATVLLGLSSCATDADNENATVEEEISYPVRVAVPEDIPSTEVIRNPKTESVKVIVPPAVYLECHYDGWQECLRRFALLDVDVAGDEIGGFALSTIEIYSERGVTDGFEACKARVLSLIESVGEGRAKAAALRAIKERKVISWNFERHRRAKAKGSS